jgi:PAS domain S-box-containing protein
MMPITQSIYSGLPSKVRKRLPNLAVFIFMTAIYLAGLLEGAELALMDMRFQSSPRDTSGEIVVVAIDPKSLQELDQWPWPREYHAKVFSTLREYDAAKIAFSVDFSSHSNAAADDALKSAFQGAGTDPGKRVILPIFKQRESSSSQVLVLTRPHPMFREHAHVAFTNVLPGSDGLVRQFSTAEYLDGKLVGTLPAFLAGMNERDNFLFYVDFSIEPQSFRVVSYADVFFGRSDPELFRGKNVIIGATAIELGDQLAVPRFQALPGPIVEALAFESLVQDRAIQRLGVVPVLFLAFLVSFFAGPRLVSASWRRSLMLLAGVTVSVVLLSFLVQYQIPVSVDVLPVIFVATLTYVFGLVRNLDRQAFRVFISSMATSHTRAVLQDLIETNLDGIIVVGGRGYVDIFNPAAAQMFKRRESDVVGRPISELFSSVTASEGMVEELSAAFFRGDLDCLSLVGLREVEFIRNDGSALQAEILVNRTNLRISRQPIERRTDGRGAFVCVVRDIGVRLEAEAKRRELQSELAHTSRLSTMGEMAAGFAHELNQPLAAINNYSSGLLRRVAEAKISQAETISALKKISEQTERAGGIIQRIRGFVRKDEPKLSHYVDINDTIQVAVAFLKAEADQKEVEIKFDLDPSNPVVSADPIQIQQVVLNLVRNSLDAMSTDERRSRRITIASRANGDAEIEISVADTGNGIPKDVLDRIFEPFYSTKSDGMGMGMLVCQKIIDAHGGKLKVESVWQTGTTISFTLPNPGTGQIS